MSSTTPLRFSVGGCIDTGPVHSFNDDYLLADLALGLVLVFDGGGSLADDPSSLGIRGSQIIQRVVREQYTQSEPRDLIKCAIRTAVGILSTEPNEYGYNDGGSVVLAFLHEGCVHIAWLGDAMAQRVSDEEIAALTWPHYIPSVMQRMAKLTAKVDQESVKKFSQVIYYHLGNGELPNPLEVVSFTPQSGDRLILTTNGVHDVLQGSRFIAACQSHPEPQACANRLIELAREHGSRDNCTCVVIAFE